MIDEPESLMLRLLRDMRAEIGGMRTEMATKNDVAELRAEIHALRVDTAADFVDVRKEFVAVRKEFGEQIVGLRRAVMEYHTSVVGHGVIISELEARVRRVEQHLNLATPETH